MKVNNNKLLHQIAALVAYPFKHSQKQITEILGISKSQVSKKLKEASNKGILKVFYCPYPAQYNSSEVIGLEMQLTQGLSDHTPGSRIGVRIFPSIEKIASHEDYDHAAYRFGREAAGYVYDLFTQTQTHYIGITWGRALRSIVDGIGERHLDSPWKPGEITEFAPLWGNPYDLRKPTKTDTFPDRSKLLSNVLSRELHFLANAARKSAAFSMRPFRDMPGFIQFQDFEDKELPVVKRALSQVSYHGILFGGKNPLIDRIDTMLCIVSAPGIEHRFWFNDVLEGSLRATVTIAGRRVKPANVLLNAALGEIGGVLLPRQGISSQEAAVLEAITSRWMGIEAKHIETCASKARQSESPGVIAIAIGATRAPAVMEVVKRGMVNVLLLDIGCAKAVADKLLKTSGRKGPLK